MVNTSYANAYKEVLIVINNLVKEDFEKIPKEYIEFLDTNANKDYNFKYDSSKPFAEQELLDDTKYMLFGLFEKFGATDIQKVQIQTFKNNYTEKLEEKKREIYNPDDIFKKNKDKFNEQEVKKVENTALVEYKEEKWYQKFFARILKIFKK